MTRGQAAGGARGYTQRQVQGYPAVHWVASHPMAGCPTLGSLRGVWPDDRGS